MAKRNPNLDFIKTIAIFTVAIIHSPILNEVLFRQPLNNEVLTAIFFRHFTAFCVPFFLLATGFLMKTKQLSRQYYSSRLIKFFVFYLAAAVIFYFTKIFLGQAPPTAAQIFSLNFFDGTWYFKLYLALILLIPFLNLIYQQLKTKTRRAWLILTLLILTILPTSPWLGIEMPSHGLGWWVLTYYFLGAYWRDYPLKIKPLAKFLLILAIAFLHAYLGVRHAHATGTIVFWSHSAPLVFAYASLLFSLFLDLKIKSTKVSQFLASIATLTLSLYLVMASTDEFSRQILTPILSEKMNFGPVFIITLLFSFGGAWLISFGLEKTWHLLLKLSRWLRHRCDIISPLKQKLVKGKDDTLTKK